MHCYTPSMRHSFTLQLEYGGELRGSEKQQLKDEITTLSTVQGMLSFGYEDDAFGRYAFFSVPTIVELHKDYYELSTFRLLLEKWLNNHPMVEQFESSQLFELSQISPKANDSFAAQQTSSSNYLRLRS